MFYYDSFVPSELSQDQLDTLWSLGWYRMNQYVFCTSHIEQNEIPFRVHWIRFPIQVLKNQSSHNKIRNRNKRFRFVIEDFSVIRQDHEELYRRYRDSISFNGALTIKDSLFGDYPTDRNIFKTKCISIFDNDKLIAGGYFDLGVESVASILHFFDPSYSRFSLGKYLILITVDYLKTHGFRYYYPGYVVEGLTKMNYKLFLGKAQSEYFDPMIINWKPFEEYILIRKEIIPTEKNSEEGH